MIVHAQRNTASTPVQVDYDKFTSLAGFGTVPSARACLVRLLNKVCGDEEASGGASPAKNTNGGEVAQETPAGKKKGASRKRKTGEFIFEARVSILIPQLMM